MWKDNALSSAKFLSICLSLCLSLGLSLLIYSLDSWHPCNSSLKQTTLGCWLKGTTLTWLAVMGGLKGWYTGVMVSLLPLKTCNIKWHVSNQMMARQSPIDYMSTLQHEGAIIWKIAALVHMAHECWFFFWYGGSSKGFQVHSIVQVKTIIVCNPHVLGQILTVESSWLSPTPSTYK